MKRLKVLISGGGIAGFTLAYWLCQKGHQPIIIEKADHIRTEGYMIDFAGTGFDVIEKMGLVQALRQKAHHIPWLILENSQGQVTAKVDYASLAQAMDNRFVTLMRHDLQEILYEAIADRIDIRLGTSITAITQTEATVTTTFTDGTTETFDLLVGADGIHSNVRQLIFGPDEQYERYLGYYVASFAVPHTGTFRSGFVNYWHPGHMTGVYQIAPDTLQTIFVYTSEDMGYIPPAKRKATLMTHYQHTGWHNDQLLQTLDENQPIFFDSVTQITMPTWHANRVVLVGDAAYCLTLISGQGASMAMGGAYILAHELGQTADLPQALTNYEARLRPHIEDKQEKARKFARTFVPGSQARIWFNTIMMKLLFTRPFYRLGVKQFAADSIFSDPHPQLRP